MTTYCLEIETFALAAEVRLNEIPVAVDATGRGLLTVRPVNEWLAPAAENELAIALGHAAEDRGLGRFRCSFFRADPSSATPRPAEVLARFVWPDPEAEARPLPLMVRLPLRVADPPALRLWNDAAPVEALTAEDRVQMLGRLEEMRRALLEGRAADAFRLGAYKFEEDARAYGYGLDELRREVVHQYEVAGRQPGLRSEPLPPEEASFDLLGRGRLVRLARRGGEHAVALRDDRGSTRLKVFFAKIGGEWRIAR